MTVKQYHMWKEGKNVKKFKMVYRFWETNPSDLQEDIRSKIVLRLCLMAFVYFLFGILLGYVLRGVFL